ncbi:MAG: aminodeoxychorismate/anthranilate synthase component II [Phycisphaerales bacterium]
MVLVLDNFDSFSWNIVHVAAVAAPELQCRVVRSDRIGPVDVQALAPSHVIISPGPCGPREAGNSVEIIRALAGRVPVLGICLGHQCIAEAFGMKVLRAPRPAHGSTSLIRHDAQGVLAGLPSPFDAMRYHSLIVDSAGIDPSGWRITAWTDDHAGPLVMGLRRIWPVHASGSAALEGVQFHPESFATPLGTRILSNFFAGPAPEPSDSPLARATVGAGHA